MIGEVRLQINVEKSRGDILKSRHRGPRLLHLSRKK